MDYNLIQEYVENNVIYQSSNSEKLSSKEKKFLKPYVDKYIDEHNL